MARRGRNVPDLRPVGGGRAELLRDADRDGGWVLIVGGVPQSYVDLADPTHLDFEYMRLLGDIVDCLGLPGEPFDAVHVGGAGCTLPRYLAATRPGSRQVVLEPDAELVALVRERLPLRGVRGVKIRITDGQTGLAAIPDASDDLVVLDAFADATVPAELVTEAFTREAARVLRPAGVYLMNIADGTRLAFARRVTATVREVFPHVLMLADPGVLRGRRFGNIVLAASRAPLPADALARRAAGGIARARLVDGADLVAFGGGAAPIRAATDVVPPEPPERVFGAF
ncbi:spermidine synthase [Actinomadura rayongensis]|uniref:Methyltransferase domain-containing protein n=1 Tax=Actinomadura rayongensis TaxID=1429076 RepID=A0A6I4WN48_9ACTN|nr:fused MFS/spermidine synthase [Actinomadura rayongensis]MXQ68364.1 methyltransferase domain-containing protein [Actinomadura rayongensis]